MTQNPNSYYKDWDLVMRRVAHLEEGSQDVRYSPSRLRFLSPDTIKLPRPLEDGLRTLTFTENAYDQLHQKLRLPKAYVNVLGERNPTLATAVLNDALQSRPEALQLRTTHGKIRGVLEETEKVVSNRTIVSSADRVLSLPYKGKSDFEIISVAIDRERFYLKIVFDDEFRDETGIREGSYLKVGVVIRNTETLHGNLEIKPFVFRYSCLNDAVVSRIEGFATKNLNIDTSVVESGISTVLASARVEAHNIIHNMTRASSRPVQNPSRRIQALAKEHGLSKMSTKRVIKAYLDEPDPTDWGIGNAFTRAAQRLNLDDRAALETIGGMILEAAPA